MTQRCAWAGSDPLYIHYHDTEWGVPTDDARTLFEFLVLEGAQAGLSWITVLRKRERYRAVFDGFDPERIVRYGDAKKAELLADPGIIRNRAKIDAAIVNARAWLDLQEAGTDPVAWLWSFVGGQPVQNAFSALGEIPATTPQSDAMSKALKARGFKFVGSTICYALMQAAGMTNDHVVSCPRHDAVTALARTRGCA
ncbi:DNA-3-methyladenine glycosylase I [Aromatoleum toluvorans]|uniref:DNA-3-methyladenine glycosylase I n=1 Tax=Aromatoleum toluvorans TaxID=92002 RepID=A0ABX1PXZ3_9RHOO|nr:DNA-3-methyladenine glycosylase I [Aromatoleum toluvorans]NMG43346.1 DNA-3-methyladenine glycosylase I [Aromatoleum toluvorans]